MKFTLKQPGLVNVSGFHVDPGYTGKLLFSGYNAGPQSVPITRGTPTFLLWYCSLDQVTVDGYDKPPRADITDLDVKHLGGEVSSPQELARRVKELEDRFKIGAWILTSIVAAVIALLVGRAVGDGGTGTSPTTTTTTIATTTRRPWSQDHDVADRTLTASRETVSRGTACQAAGSACLAATGIARSYSSAHLGGSLHLNVAAARYIALLDVHSAAPTDSSGCKTRGSADLAEEVLAVDQLQRPTPKRIESDISLIESRSCSLCNP